MDKEKQKLLQDIYSNSQKENDMYTPQVAKDVVNQRKRDLKKQKIYNLLIGAGVLLIILGLIYIVIIKYFTTVEISKTQNFISSERIPRYGLDNESEWIADFHPEFGNPNTDENTEYSFNYFWLKKTIYNMISGEKAYELKKYQEAVKYYEKAYLITPDVEDLPIRLGMCYYQIGDFDKAIHFFKKINLESLSIINLNQLGLACINAESYELASKYLELALEKDPNYHNSIKNNAYLNKELNNSNNAIKYYTKYLDSQPSDNQIRHIYAVYLAKLGKDKLALEQVDILLDTITNDPSIYHLKYHIEKSLGNFKNANQARDRVLILTDPNNTAWMDDNEFDQFRESENFEKIMMDLN